MTVDEVIAHYGKVFHLTRQTGISRNSVVAWKKRGYIPIQTQIRIEMLTHGALKASLDHCELKRDQQKE